MDEIKVGSRVRYSEGNLSWVGRVNRVTPKVVFLETDEPVPFMLAPQNIDTEAIQRSHILDESWGLGYGIADAMHAQEMAFPRGSWIEGIVDTGAGIARIEVFYKFKRPHPIRPFMEMCQKRHKGEKLCWLQASVLTVIPILTEPRGGYRADLYPSWENV